MTGDEHTGRDETREVEAGEALTVRLAREEATITTRDVVTGRVRVSTITDFVEEVLHQELRGVRAEVVRKPIDRTLERGEVPPGPRTEGDVTIIPVFEEVAVTEIRLLLKEELHITQRTVSETVEIPVTLRKQRAVVERLPVGPSE